MVLGPRSDWLHGSILAWSEHPKNIFSSSTVVYSALALGLLDQCVKWSYFVFPVGTSA